MDDAHREANQKALWNSSAGCPWVESQKTMDQMFAPIEALLAEAVVAGSPGTVLDVGCGTGATTLAVAQRLGADGRCVGVDISEAMIDAARARAERAGMPAQFVLADAETHPFEPSSFDAIMSRFGVMFFDDSIRAFANLRRAARRGARLRLVAWRSPEENPFMTTAERAAAPLMPGLPPRVPDAPGQFAFADDGRVRRILDESGWADIDIQPIDVECTLPESELTRYATRFGLVGRALEAADEETRTRVVAAVRAAFEPFVQGAEVRYVAACWMIAARVT
ncbi:MAG TPA: class I SAM-dependent methyltransferase [Gemmatimonadaceae bacterium]|jgi:SAM-dependent methyltransferase|nr:class I SAM-dependent methyltransferase [Gemmatimonadaceae bacterium]